jgi:protein involved in polysaccharide export with SLBB domain
MLLRRLFLVCLIFASLLSLSQESDTARPVSKAGIVHVVGDVHRPGVVIEHDRPITVLKALATAGGANPTANLHNAKIIRKDENGTTKVPVDIRKIMEAKAPDVTLQANDILFVPRSASKSSMPKIEIYYDVAPSAPMQDAAPIYIR